MRQLLADSLASIDDGNDLLRISKTRRDAFNLLLPVFDLSWTISIFLSGCLRDLDDLDSFFDELATGSYQADDFSHVGDIRYERVSIRHQKVQRQGRTYWTTDVVLLGYPG